MAALAAVRKRGARACTAEDAPERVASASCTDGARPALSPRARLTGGGVGMAARMALEAAVMEAEPPPYPMSGREQEGYAKRPWDWEAVAYS